MGAMADNNLMDEEMMMKCVSMAQFHPYISTSENPLVHCYEHARKTGKLMKTFEEQWMEYLKVNKKIFFPLSEFFFVSSSELNMN